MPDLGPEPRRRHRKSQRIRRPRLPYGGRPLLPDLKIDPVTLPVHERAQMIRDTRLRSTIDSFRTAMEMEWQNTNHQRVMDDNGLAMFYDPLDATQSHPHATWAMRDRASGQWFTMLDVTFRTYKTARLCFYVCEPDAGAFPFPHLSEPTDQRHPDLGPAHEMRLSLPFEGRLGQIVGYLIGGAISQKRTLRQSGMLIENRSKLLQALAEAGCSEAHPEMLLNRWSVRAAIRPNLDVNILPTTIGMGPYDTRLQGSIDPDVCGFVLVFFGNGGELDEILDRLAQ